MYAILALETQRRIFYMQNQTNASKYAPYIRLIVMFVSFLATTMTTMFGWQPLPFTDEEVNQGITIGVTVALAIYNWFKNQPVTSYGKAKEQAGSEAVGNRKDFTQE